MGVISTQRQARARKTRSGLLRNGRVIAAGHADEDESEFRPRRVAKAKRIRAHELPVFTRTLSAMLAAGIPVNDCLHALQEQVDSRSLRKILAHACSIIEDGNPLSTAFAIYPGVFDAIYTGTLRTGEASGRMAETLESLAAHLEERADLHHRVKSAMMYPVAVAALSLMLTAGILTWIVPAFEKIYDDMGRQLPAATRFLIAVSHFLREQTGPVLFFAVAMVVVLRLAARTKPGRHLLDQTILHMPIVGPLVQKLALVRFSESLSQMLSNGVPILNALQLVGSAVGNSVFKDAIDQIGDELTEGQKLSVSMKKNRCFTPLTVQMVAAGERTGKLDSFLTRIAEFYRKEVTVGVQGLTALIEPLLIVFLGVIVGGIVVCMFIPVFHLHELAQ